MDQDLKAIINSVYGSLGIPREPIFNCNFKCYPYKKVIQAEKNNLKKFYTLSFPPTPDSPE